MYRLLLYFIFLSVRFLFTVTHMCKWDILLLSVVQWIAGKELSKAEFRWFNIYSLTEWGRIVFKKPNCLLYNRKNIFCLHFSKCKGSKKGYDGIRKTEHKWLHCTKSSFTLFFIPFLFPWHLQGSFKNERLVSHVKDSICLLSPPPQSPKRLSLCTKLKDPSNAILVS